MNEKQFKQQSHDLIINIASTIGTFTTSLKLTDDDLVRTQKLVKKFDETLAEFIDSRKPKFDVGDYVVEEGEEYLFGKVITLIEVKHEEKFYGNFYVPTSNKFHDYSIGTSEIEPEYCRYATPEEIAEYKAALNFHEHGRKPFEIKTGDMLHYSINATNQIVKRAKEWGKGDFILARYTLLKTAEELEEWLADGQ